MYTDAAVDCVKIKSYLFKCHWLKPVLAASFLSNSGPL